MIQVSQYNFEGPYQHTGQLENRSGIYVILTTNNNTNYVVDVGESSQIKDRIENHDRQSCWTRNSLNGTLSVAVLYTPHLQQSGRIEIEQELRDKFHPACGIR